MATIGQLAREALGIQLTHRQVQAFSIYERELLDWNRRINLTAINEPELIHIKHFLDSLTCLIAMRNSQFETIIDIGTGAGFPGIPLKIICPTLRLTLVESVRKKAEFCSYLVEMLQLPNVEIINDRVETIAQSDLYREQYDWALARSVAGLPVVAEYLLPLVKIGGAALAMKGENAFQEAHQAQNAIQILGGHLRQLIPVELPKVAEDHYLVVMDKISATPDQYPRRVGKAVKKPL
jgi:16S rRNA (guanine527-N7)-methyltransferase